MFPSSFTNDPFFRDHGFPNTTGQLSQSLARSDGQRPDMGLNLEQNFKQMKKFMDDMSQGMQVQTSSAGRNGHSYVQSSVYSYSRNNDGQPEVYEAHHSNRHGPGGVREERKALRDSRKQLEKLAVGRHIGERGHVLEKSRDMKTNHVSQHQNLIGMTEADVDSYRKEWDDRTRDWNNVRGVRGGTDDWTNRRGVQGGRRAELEHRPHHKTSNRRT